MYSFLKIQTSSLATRSPEFPVTRAGKQMPLELGNACRLQPHPLFRLLNADGTELDLQRGTAGDNRLNDGLPRAAFVHIRDQIAVNLNSVRLELRQ